MSVRLGVVCAFPLTAHRTLPFRGLAAAARSASRSAASSSTCECALRCCVSRVTSLVSVSGSPPSSPNTPSLCQCRGRARTAGDVVLDSENRRSSVLKLRARFALRSSQSTVSLK